MGDSPAHQVEVEEMMTNQDGSSGDSPVILRMRAQLQHKEKLLKVKNEQLQIINVGLKEEQKKNNELRKKVSLLEDENVRLKVKMQSMQLINLREASVPAPPPLPLPNHVVEGAQPGQDGDASEESMQETGDDDVIPLEIRNMNVTQDVISNVIGNGRPQRARKPPARLRYPGAVQAVHGTAGRTEDNKFLCKCKAKFSSSSQRSTHIQMWNKSWKCICANCGERFSDKKQLKEHFQSASNDCTSQSGSISGRNKFQKVQREIAKRKKQHGLCPQNGSYKWMCDCGEEFESEEDFKNHEKRETSPKKFLCAQFSPGCEQTFRYLCGLRNHLITNHKCNQLIEFKKGCAKCGRMFKTDDEFKNHKRQPNCTVQGQADLVPEAQPLDPLPTTSSAVVTEPPRHPPTAQNMTDYQRPGTSASVGPSSVPLPRKISATALSGTPATPALCRCRCGMSFPTEPELTGHIMSFIRGPVFECNSCGDAFVKDHDLTEHISTSAACNNVTVKTCRMCKQSFKHLKEFNYHRHECKHYPM